MTKVLTAEEANALRQPGEQLNWIGTLGSGKERCHQRVKTQKMAEAWVRRVLPNWPGDWAVFPELHYATGEILGWGATPL